MTPTDANVNGDHSRFGGNDGEVERGDVHMASVEKAEGQPLMCGITG